MQNNNTSKNLIWHPFTPLITDTEPILIKKAKGVYLYKEDGSRIIDAISSWWVNIHGHGNEVIAEAIYEQAKNLEHVIFAGFTHEPALQLAENLKTILPNSHTKIFFSDDGSTSIEVALKMAFQFWYNQGYKNKKQVIALNGAYHGDTFGAMSVGDRSVFTKPFFSFLFKTAFIDFPNNDNEEKILEQFKTLINQEETAAFIFEPLIQGAGGMRMYSPEILDKLIFLAKEKNIICIADEVMTGFRRTGKLFATDHLENDVDIMCLSKGITGGTMAQGITSCSQLIVDAFQNNELSKALLHGHSYTGNPLACVAANASFKILMDKKCKQSCQMIHTKHLEFIKKLQQSDKVENIRYRGTIIAFELVGFGNTSYDNVARKKIYPYFLERGVLLRPLGNVIYIMPPYIITEEQLDEVYNVILEFLKV